MKTPQLPLAPLLTRLTASSGATSRSRHFLWGNSASFVFGAAITSRLCFPTELEAVAVCGRWLGRPAYRGCRCGSGAALRSAMLCVSAAMCWDLGGRLRFHRRARSLMLTVGINVEDVVTGYSGQENVSRHRREAVNAAASRLTDPLESAMLSGNVTSEWKC